MTEYVEFKKLLFKLVVCDNKEASTETYACHMLYE